MNAVILSDVFTCNCYSMKNYTNHFHNFQHPFLKGFLAE